MRASAIWPTAAAAWLSSSFSAPRGSFNLPRPSAIEPDDTIRSSRPPWCNLGRSAGSAPGPAPPPPPGPPPPRIGIAQQRRADLDDDAAEIGELGAGHGRVAMVAL